MTICNLSKLFVIWHTQSCIEPLQKETHFKTKPRTKKGIQQTIIYENIFGLSLFM